MHAQVPLTDWLYLGGVKADPGSLTADGPHMARRWTCAACGVTMLATPGDLDAHKSACAGTRDDGVEGAAVPGGPSA
jgi:hypothetical protein